MPDNPAISIKSNKQFARHHWTSMTLAILGFRLFAFLDIADEVLEDDTLRFDRSLLLALRVP